MRWRRANWARRAFHRSERRRIELPATRIAREKSYSDAYRWRTRSRSKEDGRQGIVSNRTEVRLDRTDRKVSGKAVALSTDSRAHEQEVAITAFGPNRMFMGGGRCLNAHCAMAGRRVVVMPQRQRLSANRDALPHAHEHRPPWHGRAQAPAKAGARRRECTWRTARQARCIASV